MKSQSRNISFFVGLSVVGALGVVPAHGQSSSCSSSSSSASSSFSQGSVSSATSSVSAAAPWSATLPVGLWELVSLARDLDGPQYELISLLRYMRPLSLSVVVTRNTCGGYINIDYPTLGLVAVEKIQVVTPQCLASYSTKSSGGTSQNFRAIREEIAEGGYCWALAAYHSRQKVGDLPKNQDNEKRKRDLNDMIRRARSNNRLVGQRAAHGPNFTCTSHPSDNALYGRPLRTKQDCLELQSLLQDPRNDCSVNASGEIWDKQAKEYKSFAHTVNAISARRGYLGGTCEVDATNTSEQGDANGNVSSDAWGSQRWTVHDDWYPETLAPGFPAGIRQFYFHCCRYNR